VGPGDQRWPDQTTKWVCKNQSFGQFSWDLHCSMVSTQCHSEMLTKSHFYTCMLHFSTTIIVDTSSNATPKNEPFFFFGLQQL
jgi:hypothetical protein